jgi:hypothetical protein
MIEDHVLAIILHAHDGLLPFENDARTFSNVCVFLDPSIPMLVSIKCFHAVNIHRATVKCHFLPKLPLADNLE